MRITYTQIGREKKIKLFKNPARPQSLGLACGSTVGIRPCTVGGADPTNKGLLGGQISNLSGRQKSFLIQVKTKGI